MSTQDRMALHLIAQALRTESLSVGSSPAPFKVEEAGVLRNFGLSEPYTIENGKAKITADFHRNSDGESDILDVELTGHAWIEENDRHAPANWFYVNWLLDANDHVKFAPNGTAWIIENEAAPIA